MVLKISKYRYLKKKQPINLYWKDKYKIINFFAGICNLYLNNNEEQNSSIYFFARRMAWNWRIILSAVEISHLKDVFSSILKMHDRKRFEPFRPKPTGFSAPIRLWHRRKPHFLGFPSPRSAAIHLGKDLSSCLRHQTRPPPSPAPLPSACGRPATSVCFSPLPPPPRRSLATSRWLSIVVRQKTYTRCKQQTILVDSSAVSGVAWWMGAMTVDRADGRSVNQLRPLACSRNILHRAHGSARWSQGNIRSNFVVKGDIIVWIWYSFGCPLYVWFNAFFSYSTFGNDS